MALNSFGGVVTVSGDFVDFSMFLHNKCKSMVAASVDKHCVTTNVICKVCNDIVGVAMVFNKWRGNHSTVCT
jgi:hypothetical protein